MKNRIVKIYPSKLYKRFGGQTKHGYIIEENYNGDKFYDLYNTDGELAAMDGESCILLGNTLDTYKFMCDGGEEEVYFLLSREEFKTGVEITQYIYREEKKNEN